MRGWECGALVACVVAIMGRLLLPPVYRIRRPARIHRFALPTSEDALNSLASCRSYGQGPADMPPRR